MTTRNNLENLKKNLQDSRLEKGITQEALAKATGIGRSSIAKWEGANNDSFPSIENLLLLCKELNVDPNFLLGFSDESIAMRENEQIHEVTKLSTETIEFLRENRNENIVRFLNRLVAFPELEEIIDIAKKIEIYQIIDIASKNTFSKHAYIKIKNAFKSFEREVFPLDMTSERFRPYIEKVFPWNEEEEDIDYLIQNVFSEMEYENMLKTMENLNAKEKYSKVIDIIVDISYDYYMKKPLIDMAQLKMTTTLNQFVHNFIQEKVKVWK